MLRNPFSEAGSKAGALVVRFHGHHVSSSSHLSRNNAVSPFGTRPLPQRTHRGGGLHLLRADGVLLLDAAVEGGAAGGAGRVLLMEVLGKWTVDLLFEDGFRFDGLELGLEVIEMVGVGGGVGATTGIGHVVVEVGDLVTELTPGETVRLAAVESCGRMMVRISGN